MEVPEGYNDASLELKREYLANAKTSEELAGCVRALLDSSDGRESPTLNKQELAEVYIFLQQYVNG